MVNINMFLLYVALSVLITIPSTSVLMFHVSQLVGVSVMLFVDDF